MEAVDIVVVNWNAGDLLRKCLLSIERLGAELRYVGKVIVVDNNSVDGSLADLPGCGNRLDLVRCPENYGFAKSCNIGAGRASSEYILFLNPDAEMRSGALSGAMQAAAANDNEPSVVGVKMFGPDGHVATTCARFPTVPRFLAASMGLDRIFPSTFPPHLMVEWDHCSTRVVDQVMGAFFLVKAARFRELGGFDERFFMYYEELDYCVRAAKQGRRALHLGDVAIHHVGRGTSQKIGGVAMFYAARSKLIYARKHFGLLAFLVVAATTLLAEPVVRIAVAGVGRDQRKIHETLIGFFHLWCWLLTGRPSAGVELR